jgi:hypothetical protein
VLGEKDNFKINVSTGRNECDEGEGGDFEGEIVG